MELINVNNEYGNFLHIIKNKVIDSSTILQQLVGEIPLTNNIW